MAQFVEYCLVSLFIFVFSKNELEIFGLKYFDGKKCVNYFAFIIICFSASVALVKNLFEYPFKKRSLCCVQNMLLHYFNKKEIRVTCQLTIVELF